MTEIPKTVTVTLPEKYHKHAQTVWPAIAETVRSDGYHWLADSIEEQVKPAIEEPTEFGSIVRAGSPQDAPGTEFDLWTPTPRRKHYWMSQSGLCEVWSELTDVEVLRVGVEEAHLPNLDQLESDEPAGSVRLRDHFSATISLTISEPQPQYNLVQLNARRDASNELISCDVNRGDFLDAVEKVLNVRVTAPGSEQPWPPVPVRPRRFCGIGQNCRMADGHDGECRP